MGHGAWGIGNRELGIGEEGTCLHSLTTSPLHNFTSSSPLLPCPRRDVSRLYISPAPGAPLLPTPEEFAALGGLVLILGDGGSRVIPRR
jgi:hypothetical protein